MGEKRFGKVCSRQKAHHTENIIILNLRQPKKIKSRVILNGMGKADSLTES